MVEVTHALVAMLTMRRKRRSLYQASSAKTLFVDPSEIVHSLLEFLESLIYKVSLFKQQLFFILDISLPHCVLQVNLLQRILWLVILQVSLFIIFVVTHGFRLIILVTMYFSFERLLLSSCFQLLLQAVLRDKLLIVFVSENHTRISQRTHQIEYESCDR